MEETRKKALASALFGGVELSPKGSVKVRETPRGLEAKVSGFSYRRIRF